MYEGVHGHIIEILVPVDEAVWCTATCLRACLRACEPASLRACEPACLRACVPACVRACGQVWGRIEASRLETLQHIAALRCAWVSLRGDGRSWSDRREDR
jgi:hypothetical protein